MKSLIYTPLALVALLTLSVGCGSAPEPLPPKVATGMDAMRSEAISLKSQIEKTTTALSKLMNNPEADLTPQNSSFNKELATLESRLEYARAQRKVADRMVYAQFASWDDQLARLQNEESREMAAERREETAETFNDIQQQTEELRERFAPFLTDLVDIRQYLRGDLSPKGLETMKPTAERVFDSQDEIYDKLDDIIESITKAIG